LRGPVGPPCLVPAAERRPPQLDRVGLQRAGSTSSPCAAAFRGPQRGERPGWPVVFVAPRLVSPARDPRLGCLCPLRAIKRLLAARLSTLWLASPVFSHHRRGGHERRYTVLTAIQQVEDALPASVSSRRKSKCKAEDVRISRQATQKSDQRIKSGHPGLHRCGDRRNAAAGSEESLLSTQPASDQRGRSRRRARRRLEPINASRRDRADLGNSASLAG